MRPPRSRGVALRVSRRLIAPKGHVGERLRALPVRSASATAASPCLTRGADMISPRGLGCHLRVWSEFTVVLLRLGTAQRQNERAA